MTYGPVSGESQKDPAAPEGLQDGQHVQPPPAAYGDTGQAFPGYGMPGYGAGPYGKPPPTHLIWASIAVGGGVLFNLILGFPFGLVALRNARKVRPLWDAGDQQGAVSTSRKARTWAILSTVFDVLGIVLAIVIFSLAAVNSNFNNPSVVAASIKTQLQKRLSDPSSPYYTPGLKVTSVKCTAIGAHTDSCVDYFSNGRSASETAVISADGASYRTG